ncbi:hypothetical protein JTB14_025064 [Gonioctena quinquepunctata]|nr:hypothetical protein JTB14_025064 [Gonioctena quinquepunctata]
MIKARGEMRTTNFGTESFLDYNASFSLDELEYALSSCKESAPGFDGITYAMIRHSPLNSKINLLKLYNNIWTCRVYPDGKERNHRNPHPLRQCSFYSPKTISTSFFFVLSGKYF